ncbi:hypothetical protein ACN4EG_18785 [Alkalinema pantanalense CENA528]|uniref:hypothetical protein n=1 Tax=Alkalinema pantanalense TaxID=1620705 RepID=UPI003D6FA19C
MFSHFNEQPSQPSYQGHISLEPVLVPSLPSACQDGLCIGEVEGLLKQSIAALQCAAAQIQPQSTSRDVILSLDRMKAEILDIYVMLEHIKKESLRQSADRSLSPQVTTDLQGLIDRIQQLMVGVAQS